MTARSSLLDLGAWVAEAEEAAVVASSDMEKAYDAYINAKRRCELIGAVAGNRRAVRDKRGYTPFPGIGTEL